MLILSDEFTGLVCAWIRQHYKATLGAISNNHKGFFWLESWLG